MIGGLQVCDPQGSLSGCSPRGELVPQLESNGQAVCLRAEPLPQGTSGFSPEGLQLVGPDPPSLWRATAVLSLLV